MDFRKAFLIVPIHQILFDLFRAMLRNYFAIKIIIFQKIE